MPFRRRTRTRRRRRTRRPTAMRAVKRLARFVDTELHFADIVITNPDVDELGIITPLISVPQGVDANDRDGVQISLRSLSMKFQLLIGSESVCVRFLLVIDKQVNGAEFLLADLLQDTTTDLRQLTSPINNDNRKRFTILRDWTRTLVAGHSNTICFNVRRRLTNKIRYDGIGGLIADVVSGMVYLVAFSDKTTAQTSPNMTMLSRVMFAP